MSKTQTSLMELLAHNEAYAQWFVLTESLSQNLFKRNLKLLRGLNRTSNITRAEIDQLNEQDIQKIIATAKAHSERAGTVHQIPKTASEFFHSMMLKSPYFSEIIPYPDTSHKKTTSAEPLVLSVSIHTHEGNTSKKTNLDTVHGFHLNDGEAFSSTRYFSEDKKSFATIIAKDGTFKAHQHNLNAEQKTDMAFEMAFQFLLNLPPGQKTVAMSGPPEMIHKMRAAFLQLQKESGPRYADLIFQLPEGMSIAPDELNDEYIKNHLGTPSETPSQIIQWRQFLALPTVTHEQSHESSVTPVSEDNKKALIDMERVFHTPDLSQEDKMLLNEYQRYLQETWVNDLVDGKQEPGPRIEERDEFMQRTEAALRVMHKAPSLQKEYESLKTLYMNIGESHYKMLEQLHQIELDYERQRSELLSNRDKVQRESIEECLNFATSHLNLQMRHAKLNAEQQQELALHAHALDEITNLTKDKDTLPREMVRSCYAQIHNAMHFLAKIHDYSQTPLFQQTAQFTKEQAEKKDPVKSNFSEHTASAAQQVKERLVQFKKEFQQPEAANIPVTPQMQEQLEDLDKKLDRFIKSIENDEDKKSLEHLSQEIKKISISPSTTRSQLDALNQCVDKIVPLTKDHPVLTKALTELKELTKASPFPLLSPPGVKHSDQPGLDASRFTL